MTLPPVAVAVFVAITTLLWVGAVLLWVQTYRAPENVAVRVLAACITLLAATSVLRGAQSLPVLVDNVLGVMTAAIQICFFVVVARGRAGVRRMRGELVAAVTVCAVAAVVLVAAPSGTRPVITDAALGGTPALLFSAPVLAYLGYAAGAVVFWIARILPGVVRRVLRVSLWMVAAGGVLQVAGAVMKLVSLVGGYAAGPSGSGGARQIELLVGLFVSLGFLTLALGAIVPLVDGAAREIPRALAQRRATRELEPLWRALQAEFPELVLELRSPGPGRALYRRVVEIRDGLVLLSPHFDARVAERAGARSRDAGEDAGQREAAVQAALVRDALSARREGRPVPDRPARLSDLTAPDTGSADEDRPPDWEDDATRLTRVARRFADA